MIELIEKININLLRREVAKIPLVSQLIKPKEENKNKLARVIVSYYGCDLLREPSIRHALLTTLNIKELRSISKVLRFPERENVYDYALMISSAKWNKSSDLPDLLETSLYVAHSIRLPSEYMPDYQYISPPRWEELVAENLPDLFSYQKKLSNKIYEILERPSSKCMLQMPTGSGKTRTIIHALIQSESIKKMGERYFIWLAHTEELCEQAIDAFKRSWIEYGSGVIRYYRLFGNRDIRERELYGGMIFSSLQKLYSFYKRSRIEYEIIAKNCSVLIFDEAHKALAPTYRELITDILDRSTDARLIGLSATPGRSALESSENKRLAKLFSGNLIRYQSNGTNSIKKLKEDGILAELERKEIKGIKDFQLTMRERSHLRQYMELPPSVLRKIAENRERNIAIVGEIIEQIEVGNQCLVFACSVEHAKILAAMIGINNIKAGSVTGEMRKATRARIIRDFNEGEIKVITNYGILTTGYDAPKIGAIIITRPTGSIILYSQMIGRGLRGPKVGGKSKCVLVDVVDNIIGFGEMEEVYNHFVGYWN